MSVAGFPQATVGAGLPVIATLKHLIETGDRILKVRRFTMRSRFCTSC